MLTEGRKAAIAAYKERKVVAGIYAVRCIASGQCWAGAAPDLATIENRLWFSLRLGSMHKPSLQTAYDAHGREAFSCEAVERLPQEEDAYIRGKRLKERLAHWCALLGAEPL
ncbi:GIY-YIG nuclease family protein [Arvimicrobium flavum]|uniref:GIY-YIG nuclease family protein n=1 Tax=Arvimicrobium flavum TaxID=3393320 RepID=UPI00237C3E28|nr:GIY-YIG nuclease family protein [Mesorhizobium shangrilense]